MTATSRQLTRQELREFIKVILPDHAVATTGFPRAIASIRPRPRPSERGSETKTSVAAQRENLLVGEGIRDNSDPVVGASLLSFWTVVVFGGDVTALCVGPARVRRSDQTKAAGLLGLVKIWL